MGEARAFVDDPDGIGYLTSVSDQSGSTAFVYNALGQVTADTRTIGTNSYGANYTFDASGNPLTLTYPSGRIVTYTRDALGRVSGITTQQGSGAPVVSVLTSGTYEPFGGFSGGGFGDGTTVVLGYDQDYELTSLSASAGSVGIQSLSYSYDASSNILGITDALNSARTQTLAYDDLNRLWSASGVYGALGYTYDGVGNRLTRTAGGVTFTYAYSPNANQISSITTGSGTPGTLTSAYTFGFNNAGRLTTAGLNGTGVGAYLYNGFGQRAQKTVGSTVIDLIYDRSGHLLAEANDATGAPLREYVWMDDTPVAMVDDTGSSPVVYYIHTDQLGTPQKLTDASADIVWDGVFDPFGNAVAVGADWGAGIWDAFNWEPSSPPTMPLRFPGQYADAETGLNQNGFRDYDPTIGRYVESDPLGLAAGMNTYGYVEDDVLNLIDPQGLTLQSNWNFFWDWVFGTGPRHRYYGPNTTETKEMEQGVGANVVRNVYLNKGCKNATGIAYSTAHAFYNTIYLPWTTPFQVGGFGGAAAKNNGNGTVTYTIPNTAGAHSFFYHLTNDRTSATGPMSNIYQTFSWTEKNPCGCHN